MSQQLLRCALLAVGTLVCTNCGAASTATPAIAETIALNLTGPRPTAQLTIGDDRSPATAIFDTGAAASIVMLDYARRHDLPNQGEANAHGPGGAPLEGFRTTLQGRLGGAHFGPTLAIAIDIRLPLPGVDAIISPSVFSGRLVRIDFARSIAEILPKTAAEIPAGPANSNAGGALPMSVTSVPAVAVVLPTGRIIQADLDTGAASGLSVPLALAQGIPLEAPMTRAGTERMVGIDRATFIAHVAGDVRVGPLVLHDPAISFVDGGARPTVGMEILRQSIVVLDPAEHRSWMLAGDADGHPQ